ncbi:hypothetical protein Y032_0004g2242 [Ancylostoma ceylanicum]|uniref:Uncharacterized protein n=1 Tax=Ancylostoma ceylanicum TaxID=53326 RepID=A0A016VVJ9_9BILA|nr:hypothetical protein Y032_0004g2242 [Ancylostoma ceylanicum]
MPSVWQNDTDDSDNQHGDATLWNTILLTRDGTDDKEEPHPLVLCDRMRRVGSERKDCQGLGSPRASIFVNSLLSYDPLNHHYHIVRELLTQPDIIVVIIALSAFENPTDVARLRVEVEKWIGSTN